MDIELIIRIPEEKYNMIKNKLYCGIYDAELYQAIADGIRTQLAYTDTDGSWYRCSNSVAHPFTNA